MRLCMESKINHKHSLPCSINCDREGNASRFLPLMARCFPYRDDQPRERSKPEDKKRAFVYL